MPDYSHIVPTATQILNDLPYGDGEKREYQVLQLVVPYRDTPFIRIALVSHWEDLTDKLRMSGEDIVTTLLNAPAVLDTKALTDELKQGGSLALLIEAIQQSHVMTDVGGRISYAISDEARQLLQSFDPDTGVFKDEHWEFLLPADALDDYDRNRIAGMTDTELRRYADSLKQELFGNKRVVTGDLFLYLKDIRREIELEKQEEEIAG